MNNINENMKFIEIMPETEITFLYDEVFGTYHAIIENVKIFNDNNYAILFDGKSYLDVCNERKLIVANGNRDFDLKVNQALGNVALFKDFFKVPIISKYSKSNYPFFITYNYSKKALDVLIEYDKKLGKDYKPVHKLQIYKIFMI